MGAGKRDYHIFHGTDVEPESAERYPSVTYAALSDIQHELSMISERMLKRFIQIDEEIDAVSESLRKLQVENER